MKKGLRSKIQIISESAQILNKKGNGITLNELAEEIGISRGRINHFFPTRDSLFLAIANAFEKKFSEIQVNFNSDLEIYENKLMALLRFYDQVMDLQYEYRCSVIYIISQLTNDAIQKHTKNTYQKAKNLNRMRIKILVERNILKPAILEQENFDPFFFQVSNLLTNWLVSYFLYDRNKSLNQIKLEYISGIMRSYYFYFTEQGLELYQDSMDDYAMKMSLQEVS